MNHAHKLAHAVGAIARVGQREMSFRDRFGRISEVLADLIPSMSASAVIVDLREPNARPPEHLAFFRNGPDATILDYAEEHFGEDPMRSGAQLATGEAVVLRDFVPSSRMGMDRFTGDYLASLGIADVLAIAARMPDRRRLLFAVHRGRGERRFSERDRQNMSAVSRYVAWSATGIVIASQVAELTSVWEEGGPLGVVAFGRRGEVVHSDLAAIADSIRAPERQAALIASARELLRSRARVPMTVICEGRDLRAACIRSHSRSGVSAIVAFVLPSRHVVRPFDSFLAEMSARQREVSLLAVRGLTNSEIGTQLQLSVSAVKKYLADIFEICHVGDRHALTLLAVSGSTEAPR